MIDRQQMLIKVAKQDKSASLVANIVLADRMTKLAHKEAIRGFIAAKAMNKKADFSDFLNKAWSNAKDWWKDDANKAGLAGGALGALGTYGLTGLVPGLKDNTALRLALSGAGGYAGMKGGKYAWNTALSRGNAAGQEQQKKLDDEELKNRESEWKATEDRLKEGITAAEDKGRADLAAAKARAAEQLAAAESGYNAKINDMQTVVDSARAAQAEAEAARAEAIKKNEIAGTATTLRHAQQGRAYENKRIAEINADKLQVNKVNAKGWLTDVLGGVDIDKLGYQSIDRETSAAIQASLNQQIEAAANYPEYAEYLRGLLAAVQSKTVAKPKSPAVKAAPSVNGPIPLQ